MKRTTILLAKLCILLAMLFAPKAAHARPVKVERVSFPVTLSDNHVYAMVGYLYHQGSIAHRPLQVLAHGSTYNHQYWDAPVINGHGYSYARHMAKRGYAVLALDQLGTGESDAPPGDFLSIDEIASSMHQVLSGLRTRRNPTQRKFEHITLVGHSLGSLAAIYTAGTYGDVDALVVTGTSLAPHPLPYDAATVNQLLSVPYPTISPEVRAALFYDAPMADPDVILHDNTVMRDVVPRGELTSLLPLLADPALLRVGAITAPVLVLFGEHDLTAPAEFAPGEANYYSSAERVEVAVVPEIGHDLNLHVNNNEAWDLIENFLDGCGN